MSRHTPTDRPATPALTVLYDGSCPLCQREIGVYQGLAARSPVCFTDISATGQALPDGCARERLMARFHVQDEQGRLLDGAAAFVALWERLPGWRWLARLARVPGLLWLMERAYRGFLRVRPRVQAWVRRRG